MAMPEFLPHGLADAQAARVRAAEPVAGAWLVRPGEPRPELDRSRMVPRFRGTTRAFERRRDVLGVRADRSGEDEQDH